MGLAGSDGMGPGTNGVFSNNLVKRCYLDDTARILGKLIIFHHQLDFPEIKGYLLGKTCEVFFFGPGIMA